MTHHRIPTLLALALATAFAAACSRAPQQGHDGQMGDEAYADDAQGANAQPWPDGNDAGDGLQPDMSARMVVSDGGGRQMAMPPPPDTRRLRPAQIIDKTGAGQPMVVADLQVPDGWDTVGGVTWNNQTSCVTNRFQMGWTTMAPDSLTAVELLPGFNWQVAGTQIQMNPCPVAPYRSTREFLQATVQRTRPGARVLDYQDQPDVASKAAAAAPAPMGGARIRHDAGRLLIAYDKDGVEMREMLSATVTFSEMQGNVVAGTSMISSSRAPNGRLDMGLTERIGETVRVNPQWAQAITERGMAAVRQIGNDQRASINDWHNRQMAIINARGAADRHAIRMRTNQEVAGIYSSIAANTSATNDRIHARTVDTINGVNSYAGTDGSVVKSSIHGGDRVFQSNRDPNQAYNTNDPYHDPTDATELERIP
ncbi:hypothetical protein [uncultured Pseudoxanthomonas sp.]|uniref:hypothetical protein n=1 Tax=uncultured Pseudoxanthomonas sp. TaxID=281701 RepID=UPI00261E89DB|nr:hypothetical protein [uncultured Pseudoxanthomonas sp.]